MNANLCKYAHSPDFRREVDLLIEWKTGYVWEEFI